MSESHNKCCGFFVVDKTPNTTTVLHYRKSSPGMEMKMSETIHSLR
jgi:hypothetical protein